MIVKKRVDKDNVVSLERQMNDFKESSGKIISIEMIIEIMDITKEELRTK
jgi:peroxiredoxin family protein